MALELFSRGPNRSDLTAQLAALNRAMAVISFTPDGKIISANENFLGAMGYTLAEISGRQHSLFVQPEHAAGAEYAEFWAKLRRGEFIAAQFPRVAAGGREVWIEASYNPLFDRGGKVYRIVKYATVITQSKALQADNEGQIAAINKAMAVIEFALDGTILKANENFLATTGYSAGEIVGKHHGMFCPDEIRNSDSYRLFWQKLGRGEYDSGQYRRVAKGGRPLWLEASYNPIMDAQGRPMKVVKYASDITAQKNAATRLSEAVEQTTSVIEAAKNKDLTKRIDMDGKAGEIATFCSGVNSLIDSMSGVITTVGGISRQIKSVSTQFASDSARLAERTETQAASLQETAATTEELAASIKQSAGHSRQAAALGNDARSVATHGGEIVSEAVTAMERIEKASASISEIIAMIDEISFQTNLLALNAAVEAARAGDAGRGFAVVASEVRALAKRSSESAHGIKELIANSSEQVRSGVRLVKEAGVKLGEIVTAASTVASTIAEISSAAGEQASGVDEMAKVVAHMDEITQQNSLLADGSSKLARELLNDAEELDRTVEAFVVAGRSPRALSAQIAAELAGAAPHLRRAEPATRPAASAAPKLRAAGGSAGGWEEF